MLVTLVMGKIVYGNDIAELSAYVAKANAKGTHSKTAANALAGDDWAALQVSLANNGAGAPRAWVELNAQQFLRFKNAGRQSMQASAKSFADPASGTTITYRRAERGEEQPEKWDVVRYRQVAGRGIFSNSNNDSDNNADRLRVQASKQAQTADPAAAAHADMAAMMGWKTNPANRKQQPSTRSTLRIEMVGAYFHLYKQLAEQDIIRPSKESDDMLLHYLQAAAQTDDGFWRIDPAGVGLTAVTQTSTASGTKWQV